ncbi:urea ABC transporter permease subunit UrtB, partial [bacterium]|nr:urea ABC transporter permease subunit UrtB [bacterium]
MNIIKIILLNLLIFSFSYSSDFQELSTKLSDKSFKVKEQVLDELIVNFKEEEKLEILLQNMLLGNLYYKNETNEIFISNNSAFKGLFTDELLETEDNLSKVKINNKLRSVIKSSLAKINLFSKNVDKRV